MSLCVYLLAVHAFLPEVFISFIYKSGKRLLINSYFSRTDEENYEDFGVGESDSSDANAS